nr:hypothetical protein HJG59_010745 [Molossus molossus]
MPCLCPPHSDPVHLFQPRDSVWVKKFTTQGLTPAWKGPYTVILTTRTAVKVNGIPTWLHHSWPKGKEQNGRSRPLQFVPLKVGNKEGGLLRIWREPPAAGVTKRTIRLRLWLPR